MLLRALVLLAVVVPSFTFASPWSEKVHAEMARKVAKHFANNTQVGIMVGVFHEGETQFWAFGERVKGSRELPTADTFFEMGSITKTFTATLLARETLEGRVRLETKVKSLWRELEGSDAGEITLEQLASHTSGLPRMPDNFPAADPENPYADYTDALLLAYLQGFKQERPGPYKHDYSNLGFGLLGYLLSTKLHGQAYADYLRANLTGPLGLRDTKTALLPADRARAAQGYDSFFKRVPFWDLGSVEGAGVLKTTIRELLGWATFNMAEGDSLLSRAAALAQQPRVDSSDGPDVKVGLAWESLKLGDYDVITHGGATGGYRANLLFDKKKRVAAVILSNTELGARCVLAPVFGNECEVEEWAQVDPSRQAPFLGSYFSDEIKTTATISLAEGVLALQLPEQPLIRLFPMSETFYKITVAKAEVRFSDGTFGLTQGGKTYTFVKK